MGILRIDVSRRAVVGDAALRHLAILGHDVAGRFLVFARLVSPEAVLRTEREKEIQSVRNMVSRSSLALQQKKTRTSPVQFVCREPRTCMCITSAPQFRVLEPLRAGDEN